MRTTGYAAQRGINPNGLVMALGATALVVLGLATAAPKIITRIIDHPFIADPIPLPPPPPPRIEPQPKPHQQHALPKPQPVDRPDPVIKTPVQPNSDLAPVDPNPRIDPGPTTGTGAGGGVVIDPPKPPVLVGAAIDPAHAGDFQPFYPPSERQMGREGRVVIRVLIGTDGRVRAVEPVSATSDAFLEATRRRALERWRFKPATRDGVAVESWKQMAVSFHLQDEQ